MKQGGDDLRRCYCTRIDVHKPNVLHRGCDSYWYMFVTENAPDLDVLVTMARSVPVANEDWRSLSYD